MLLAIDTATRWLGLALYNEEGVQAEWGWRCLNMHTVSLAPSVMQLVDQSGIDIEDLTGVAVAIGPGSYTGLRIGLGFAKGVGLSRGIPIFGIPTLDIVAAAMPASTDAALVVIAEAGRSRILAGRYRSEARKGWIGEDRPVITTWPDLIESITEPTHLAGEISRDAAAAVRKTTAPIQTVPLYHNTRRAGVLAALGWQRLQRNDQDDPATLAPLYMRNPDGS